jgi:hypothetical protein
MKNESRSPSGPPPRVGFPPGWDEERVRSVLEYYESQTEDEAVAEDEAAYKDNQHYTMMDIPHELVPAVRELISKHDAKRKAALGGDRTRESQRREA